MKCQQCSVNEATVHEVRIKDGKRHEKHLCESCAKAEGVAPGEQAHVSVTDLLTQYITAQTQAASDAAAGVAVPVAPTRGSTVCAGCQTTYNQFRQSGLLGCPECYATFEAQLGPLLARAHEGGTHHTGKTPTQGARTATAVAPTSATTTTSTAPAPLPLAQRVLNLKKLLAEALAVEDYKKAAKLRDELAALETQRPGGEGRS